MNILYRNYHIALLTHRSSPAVDECHKNIVKMLYLRM